MRTMSPAMKRYMVRFAIMMTLYVLILVGAKIAFQAIQPEGPVAYALAIAPALPILGVFWAVLRLLIEEPDEYIRMLFMRQCMIATGFCLTIVTIWQWLQNFDLVPPGNGGFGAAFFWFVGLGVGALYNHFTADYGED